MFDTQLKKYRKKAGITQGELATKLDMSRSAITNWENNFSEPSIEMLVKISNIFNVGLDELIGTNYYALNVDRIKLLNIYNNLNPEGKRRMLETVEVFADNPMFKISDSEDEVTNANI